VLRTVLIANRGEIACRVIRTCRRLGLRTVAVYSAADAAARHVAEADEALLIGPPPVAESYGNPAAILAAARRAGADAIHPGFGFLSENADFARACQDAGVLFIGPGPDAIAAMGNKRAAKLLMAERGVPILPGYSGADQADPTLLREAERIGAPLMIKAAAGGGGVGMRLLRDLAELPAALASVRREAQAAFGSAEVILERALLRPRHVEVQIFGDRQGNLIHLGERECSIQRRHQKIVEEAPSPALTPALRAAMGAAAVAAGRAIGYTNAGTVEFLLDEAGEFYFLEMNTRLQVEHPVTEEVTGLDLVEWQLLVAEGAALPLAQDDVALRGHAIEVRLYAEDPERDFAPATGPVLLWREPADEGVRVESGVRGGDEISVYYDPMLAKIIARGPDRAAAIRRLARALEQTTLFGCATNLSFLRRLVLHPAFVAGDLSTAFLAEHGADLAGGPPEPALWLALLAATLLGWQQQGAAGRYWRNNPGAPVRARYRAGAAEIDVLAWPSSRVEQPLRVEWTAGGRVLAAGSVEWQIIDDQTLAITLDGHRQTVRAAACAGRWWAQVRGEVLDFAAVPLLPEPRRRDDEGGSTRAPMPGAVAAVLVEVGQAVEAGAPLLRLEAMKMEHTIRAAVAGTVSAIYCAAGDTVQADAVLIALDN
jgi:acetyl-CoA carboxylase biotin carboxylase subunit